MVALSQIVSSPVPSSCMPPRRIKITCLFPREESLSMAATREQPETVLPSTLPPLRSICPDLASVVPLRQSEIERVPRHHTRAISLPSMFPSPSFHHRQRSSLHDLLQAIDLDERMRAKYMAERAKCAIREFHSMRRLHHPCLARRRSKSAPGAMPTGHPYALPLQAKLTQSIVQKHLEQATRH